MLTGNIFDVILIRDCAAAIGAAKVLVVLTFGLNSVACVIPKLAPAAQKGAAETLLERLKAKGVKVPGIIMKRASELKSMPPAAS